MLLFSINTKSEGAKMLFEQFESRFEETETCLMLLMKNSRLLRQLQVNSQTLASMHCGRSSHLLLDLKAGHQWRSLENAKASYLLSVSTISQISLQRSEIITKRIQKLLKNYASVNILRLLKNTFHQLLQILMNRSMKSWKKSKKQEKNSLHTEHLQNNIEQENTPITYVANHSLSKLRLSLSRIQTFHELHYRTLLMMGNSLNGSVKKTFLVISHILQVCSHSSEPMN